MTTVLTDQSSLTAKLDALPQTGIDDLRRLWRRLHHDAPPSTFSKDLLILGIAWRLQVKQEGGLSPAIQRRIAGLDATMAEKGELPKVRTLQLKPGTRLMRVWQGTTHTVLVRKDGFEWQSERYASLSAIARKITGARWSGPRFFGLNRPKTSEKADG
jgi:hypothetical protein